MLRIYSRELQSQFAAERNWSQFHTPRNLLLALVGVSRVQMLPNSVAFSHLYVWLLPM